MRLMRIASGGPLKRLTALLEKELEIYLKVQEQLNEAYEGDIQRMKAYFR